MTPEASGNGAERMLLHFLRWLRVQNCLEFGVMLLGNGELAPDFREVGPVILADGPPARPSAVRLLRRFAWYDEACGIPPTRWAAAVRAARTAAAQAASRTLAHAIQRAGPHDLVYLNTVHAGSVLSSVAAFTRIMTHVHELEFELRLQRRFEPRAISQTLSRTSRYIVASHAVARALQTVYGVDPRQMEVCHEFLPPASDSSSVSDVAPVREQLGLDETALIVGTVGSVEWRKGADLFIQLAERLLKRHSVHTELAFVWVGRPLEPWWEEAVRHDVCALGLEKHVHFLGAVDDPAPLIEAMDVFVLTSRADAFPLAGLEAAATGKPVVCFDAGGMPELVSEDLVLPYLDLDAMAIRIHELLLAPDERERIGRQLAEKVNERHRVDSAGPVLLEQIERALAAP